MDQMKGTDRIWTDTEIAQTHHIMLDGPLMEPFNYYEDFRLLQQATDKDTIVLHLNGPGGYADTATQYIKYINESQALVIGSIEGECKSAHTFLFLSCHGFEVSPHCQFLAHDYSSGTYGKGSDQYKSVIRDNEWYDDYAKTIYKGFLTDEEIASMLKGEDYHFGTDEILERCQRMVDIKEAELPPIEQPEGTVDIDGKYVAQESYDMVVKHYLANQADKRDDTVDALGFAEGILNGSSPSQSIFKGIDIEEEVGAYEGTGAGLSSGTEVTTGSTPEYRLFKEDQGISVADITQAEIDAGSLEPEAHLSIEYIIKNFTHNYDVIDGGDREYEVFTSELHGVQTVYERYKGDKYFLVSSETGFAGIVQEGEDFFSSTPTDKERGKLSLDYFWGLPVDEDLYGELDLIMELMEEKANL